MATSVDRGQIEGQATPMGISIRMVERISRARWFGFLRRVYQYQNGSRSDLQSNPFNAQPWLQLEAFMLLLQMVAVTTVMALSKKETPVWPLRIWIVSYAIANVLNIPILCWRYRCTGSSQGRSLASDAEQQRSPEEPSIARLMNKARAYLELFYALWFVMGNVWVFDSRLSSFSRAPMLHVLCIVLLAWNAVVYSFPFLLFLLLCCFVPIVGNLLGYNMNLASGERGASNDQIQRLPHWTFKDVDNADDVAYKNSVSFCNIIFALVTTIFCN
ncbi:hypothetical protein HPP92_023838 [Vanilla planifolia]|uniref:Uncharacterized protein n=1 Tax=Vanilla planifolia TaxID=51239 RepID=A0A835PLB3_VANPL|nr:hypothetical protein HPP92_023838 [Vanilla planifolia]